AASAVADRDTVLGTRGFMAPEQERGLEVDARADVYALGAMLTWLTGDGRPPRPLRAIAARAMAADPRDRYPSAESLAADVARFRAGHAVDAHHESVLERVGRFARTYRTAILLVAAYVVMRAIV